MTKEELENEAEEWLNKWELCNKCKNKVDCISNFSYCKKVVLQSYLASAEPREKQIQIDAEQIRALQKQNGELTDKVKELEAQIEKIKCLNEEIIKALNECLDYEWLHAHNGKAKYLYLQTVIDIVNEKFEEIKEK